MPTLQELIDRYHAAQAARPTEAPALPTPMPAPRCLPSPTRRSDDVSRWRQGAARLGISYATYRQHMLDGEKWCSFHRRWHDEDAFDLARSRNTMCRAGRAAYMRVYMQRRREQAS